MGLSFVRYAYALSDCPTWPTLQKAQAIPDHLKSRYAKPKRRSSVGLGYVKTVTAVLAGEPSYYRRGDDLAASYNSNTGTRHVVGSVTSPGGVRTWHDADRMQGPALLCLMEAVLLNPSPHEEVRERWRALIHAMEHALGTKPPYDAQEIAAAATSNEANEAMMAVTDAIYFAMREADDKGRLALDPAPPPTLPSTDSGSLFPSPVPPDASPVQLPVGRVLHVLRALVATGGTALLVGPTGTLKTTTAKRAALDAGAALVPLPGRPGIEDRDFFGGIYPTTEGPCWVDGPVTEAFRKARDRRTVLLVDELLRFNPHYAGAFVGLLDTYDRAEVEAMGAAPAGDGPHLVAALPTGERVAAPTANLTLIATTNIGDEYVQAGDLGTALLRRFEAIIEMERADPDVARALYAASHGDDLAKVLVDIEAFTHDNLARDGGLLARPANPGVLLNLARAAERSRTTAPAGAAPSPAEALTEAAQITVVPYCAERLHDGRLDPAGSAFLLDEITRLAGRLQSAS